MIIVLVPMGLRVTFVFCMCVCVCVCVCVWKTNTRSNERAHSSCERYNESIRQIPEVCTARVTLCAVQC